MSCTGPVPLQVQDQGRPAAPTTAWPIARADMSIIGTWNDNIRVDQAAVAAYAKPEHPGPRWWTCARPSAWPGTARRWAKSTTRTAIRCMHCINLMPKALRQGQEKGATILVGRQGPHRAGARSWVRSLHEDGRPYDNLKTCWQDVGVVGRVRQDRERIGESLDRLA